MCGIAGLWDVTTASRDDLHARADEMGSTLAHRGPDACGVWVDDANGVALAHRRLSIIDLSSAGAQPMASPSGRWMLTFNGEIYNFVELRARLAASGREFRGGSDTEVILQAIEEWGIRAAIAWLEGMFAFAAWDRQERALYLVRDRLGKKPLYLYSRPKMLLFGSELKALCCHPRFERRLDAEAVSLFMRYYYVPSPYCIYENTRKLEPGCYAVIDRGEHGRLREPRIERYWDPLPIAAADSDPVRDPRQAADELEHELRRAVAQRMVADVPLGALLSGGIDSATVVAMMQSQSSRPVRTFTIGFADPEHDESKDARAIAEHLGTDHTELRMTPDDSLAVIPEMPDVYDEPFADSSQMPTLIVSRLARESVTVALAGDGGDELFGGYQRYTIADQLWHKIGWAPDSVRRAAASSLRLLSPESWDRLMSNARPFLPRPMRMRLYGDKAHKLSRILDSGGREYLYRRLITFFDDPAQILEPATSAGGQGAVDPVMRLQRRISGELGISDFVFQMMLLDLKTYLPEDILVKVDRASMAASLEVRAPLLDHRLVEMSCRLPMDLKLRRGTTKWLLRQVLYRHVPESLMDRPKVGFGVPIGPWLRGPLRDWAEELIEPGRLAAEGIFQSSAVRELWNQHLAGTHDWKYHLWGVLMFQAWRERWSAS